MINENNSIDSIKYDTSSNGSIYVLTHKKFDCPIDEMYLPLLNGSINYNDDFGYLRDDSGDNISDLNKYYAEMTGEYWAWKNSDADIIGFCHYRRYFAKNISLKILERNDIEEILKDYDIIMPNRVRMGMTNVDDIKKTRKYLDYGPYIEDYCKLRNILEKDYPDYLPFYDEMLTEKTCYWFNMFICRKELADDYFEWVFDILKKMESEIDFEKYPENQRRILGFLSERLINVYIKKNQLKVKEKPILISDRKIPLIYVIGFRFSIVIPLFKFFTQIKYEFSKRNKK